MPHDLLPAMDVTELMEAKCGSKTSSVGFVSFRVGVVQQFAMIIPFSSLPHWVYWW